MWKQKKGEKKRKEGVLKNFGKITVKFLCQSLFLLKLQDGNLQIFKNTYFVVRVRACVMCLCVYICVWVCVCVCVCLNSFTVSAWLASSVWINWNAREQINDGVLETFLSSDKSLHRYFRMRHQAIVILKREVAIWLWKAKATKSFSIEFSRSQKKRVLKKIRLFCSNVVASLWRALLVDAVVETS